MHIADASPIEDHLLRAIREEFYMAQEIPLPGELSESIRLVNNSDPGPSADGGPFRLNRSET